MSNADASMFDLILQLHVFLGLGERDAEIHLRLGAQPVNRGVRYPREVPDDRPVRKFKLEGVNQVVKNDLCEVDGISFTLCDFVGR